MSANRAIKGIVLVAPHADLTYLAAYCRSGTVRQIQTEFNSHNPKIKFPPIASFCDDVLSALSSGSKPR